MSKHQVYRIQTFSAGKNSHYIDREESWVLKKDKTFETEQEAKQYIRERSMVHTDLALFTTDIADADRKRTFVNDFCFDDDKYYHLRRFFLCTDESEAIAIEGKMKRELEKDGVRFVKM